MTKKISAIEARAFAQQLAFSPLVFQAVRCLWKLGVLEALDEAPGCDRTHIQNHTNLSSYALGVLLDMGESVGVISRQNTEYSLEKPGYFILHDKMTQVNFDFVHDICYRAAFHLQSALETGKPAGLAEISNSKTVYEGLSELSPDLKKSWFAFDHYYSDSLFGEALPIVFSRPVSSLMDVGGNTGRWAQRCLSYSEDVTVTIVDLPNQLVEAKKNLVDFLGDDERLQFHAADLLDESSQLPSGYDVIWMSQFLDCFSETEIVEILSKARGSLSPSGRIVIAETFPDRQRFDASSYSLNATTLYFSCVANGNSRMYPFSEFQDLVSRAGLKIENIHDQLGVAHSLLECLPG